MKNIVCVSAIANLAAHCIIAVYDNGSGKKLVSGAPARSKAASMPTPRSNVSPSARGGSICGCPTMRYRNFRRTKEEFVVRRNSVEHLPLTLREQEAELEAVANARPLMRLPKPVTARKVVRNIRVEKMALTAREREAEAEIEKRELGVILPL